MKKLLPILALSALLVCPACSPALSDDPGTTGGSGERELSLWTFPVGGWGTANSVSPILSSFRREHPEIRVTLTCIDYATGDSLIEEAIERGEAPDIILEGPERLVANWGARGLLAPLNDLWQDETAKEIDETVASACHDAEGNYYISPICMTAHCMAINRDLFEAAGAFDFIDEKTHTWTTQGFVKAVEAIKNYYDANGIDQDVAVVYCNGQGGDQGTRALVNNLYGGTFTDETHTSYTVYSEENMRALDLLRNMDGIRFDATMTGADEQNAFCNGELAMSFCWNVAGEVNQTITRPDREFDIFPMAFPTDREKPSLQWGIWGLGIFDHRDEGRLAAAKEFVRFVTQADYASAVKVSSYLPVRTVKPDPYANDALMKEYDAFREYVGDYYQVTPHWAEARTAWWNLLKRVGEGEDIAAAFEAFPLFDPE